MTFLNTAMKDYSNWQVYYNKIKAFHQNLLDLIFLLIL